MATALQAGEDLVPIAEGEVVEKHHHLLDDLADLGGITHDQGRGHQPLLRQAVTTVGLDKPVHGGGPTVHFNDPGIGPDRPYGGGEGLSGEQEKRRGGGKHARGGGGRQKPAWLGRFVWTACVA